MDDDDETSLLMHLHQNQSEMTGSLERTRGSGGAAATMDGRPGGSRRRSGDSDLMEIGVVERNNNNMKHTPLDVAN